MVVMDSPHGQSSGPALRSPFTNFWGTVTIWGIAVPNNICRYTLYMQIHYIYVFYFYIIYSYRIHYIALYFTYIKSWITMACPKLSIGVYTENWLRSNCIRMPRFSRHSLSKKIEENTGKFYAKSSPATDNQKHP